jgi:hypothetical protein
MIDHLLFSREKLISELLRLDQWEYHWRRNLVIVPNYMPPYPRKETTFRCVVKFECSDLSNLAIFLRHSAGPRQGFFWDLYGDDFYNVNLALMACLEAPPPPAALKVTT